MRQRQWRKRGATRSGVGCTNSRTTTSTRRQIALSTNDEHADSDGEDVTKPR